MRLKFEAQQGLTDLGTLLLVCDNQAAIRQLTFLGEVVSWDGERNLLPYGGAIAVVIAALTYFLSQRGK